MLFLFTDCQTEDSIESLIERDISIQDVKSTFNTIEENSNNLRTNERSLRIVWDNGIYKKINGKDVLIFPIDSKDQENGQLFMETPNSDKRLLTDHYNYATAYKNERGKIVIEYTIPVSTSDTEYFTGFLLVSDWKGNAKRKVYYQNGSIIDIVALNMQVTNESASMRQESNTCYIVDNYSCVHVQTPYNEYTSCRYEGSTMYCDAPQSLAPVSWDPDLTSGGGPSGSSGPGGTCEHPFIDGLYVDCEEVICSGELVSDENGDCVEKPEPCDNNDTILEDGTIQEDLLNIWIQSLTDSSTPLSDRRERGGWIVRTSTGYDVFYFAPTFVSTPCGIDFPSNWLSTIPANVVGYIHSHPFSSGDNVTSVCGSVNGGEAIYEGEPSDYDYWLLLKASGHLKKPDLVGYIIDADHIGKFNVSGVENTVYYNRCGY
jgi:hypothetical protein